MPRRRTLNTVADYTRSVGNLASGESFRMPAGDPCWDRALNEQWKRNAAGQVVWTPRRAADRGKGLKRAEMLRSWKQCQKEWEREQRENGELWRA